MTAKFVGQGRKCTKCKSELVRVEKADGEMFQKDDETMDFCPSCSYAYIWQQSRKSKEKPQ